MGPKKSCHKVPILKPKYNTVQECQHEVKFQSEGKATKSKKVCNEKKEQKCHEVKIPVHTEEKKQKCKQVYKKECKPSYNYGQECKDVPEQKCEYVTKTEYKTTYEKKCNKVAKKECKNVPEQKCHYISIPKVHYDHKTVCKVVTKPYCHTEAVEVPALKTHSKCIWPGVDIKDDYR